LSLQVRAAIRATVATGVGALLLLIPGLNAILFVALMLPLWVLSNMGVSGLGSPLNGFFIPSAIGWTLVALVVWLMAYLLFRGTQLKD